MGSPEITVVIPARGGSARIPRKNIRPFNGEPMMSWPIRAALSVPAIGRVVVSTEDPDIAQCARDYGAEVPFSRPAELASATAGTAPVIQHAIDTLGITPESLVVCLYPTSAITGPILAEALEVALGSPERFTISIARHRSPLERSLVVGSDGLTALASHDHLLTRTQDLPARYFDAGKFYAARAAVWAGQSTMMAEPFVPYFIPEWASVDLDEPEDWPIAEALHRAFGLGGGR